MKYLLDAAFLCGNNSKAYLLFILNLSDYMSYGK